MQFPNTAIHSCVCIITVKGKDKVIPLPAMKAYRKSRGIAPLIRNLGYEGECVT